MGFQVGAACYDTAAAAASAIAAAETGKVVPAGSVVYVVDAAASAASITYTLNDAEGAQASVVYQSTPTLHDCGLMGAEDALVMGWGVVAAWIAAYALLAIRKGW